jgi:hypothetical protein
MSDEHSARKTARGGLRKIFRKKNLFVGESHPGHWLGERTFFNHMDKNISLLNKTNGSYLRKTRPTEFKSRIDFFKKEIKNLSPSFAEDSVGRQTAKYTD